MYCPSQKPEAVDLDASHARERTYTCSQQRLSGEHPPPVSWQILRGRRYSYSTQSMAAQTHATLYLYVEPSVGTTAHNQSVLVRSGSSSRFHTDRSPADSKLQRLIFSPRPRLYWIPSNSWSSPIGTNLISCIMNCTLPGSRRVRHLSLCHRLGYKT